jgi:hypothetical protein
MLPPRWVTHFRPFLSSCAAFVPAASRACPPFPSCCSMVRRGSTVRVRQRALQKRRKTALSQSKQLARAPVCCRYGAVYGAFRSRPPVSATPPAPRDARRRRSIAVSRRYGRCLATDRVAADARPGWTASCDRPYLAQVTPARLLVRRVVDEFPPDAVAVRELGPEEEGVECCALVDAVKEVWWD